MFLHNVCPKYNNQKHFIDRRGGNRLPYSCSHSKILEKCRKKKLYLSKNNKNRIKYIRNVPFTRKNSIYTVK